MSTWWPWRKPKREELSKREEIFRTIQQLPRETLALCAFVCGGASILATRYARRRWFRRIPNGDWFTPSMLTGRRWIKGYVTRYALTWLVPRAHAEQRQTGSSVGDADNFRIYHMPGFGWSGPFKFRIVPSSKGESNLDHPCMCRSGNEVQKSSRVKQSTSAWLGWTPLRLLASRVYMSNIH